MPSCDDAERGKILPEEDITGGGKNMPYIASPWLWKELEHVNASRCSLVEYSPNEACCFPLRYLKSLSQDHLEQIVRHGKVIGSIKRINQALSSFRIARSELISISNGLAMDNGIVIPPVVPPGKEGAFANTVIHRAGVYVSAARRLIDQIDSSAKELHRSQMFSYETIKKSLDAYGRLMNIPLGMIVPLRDALEHTPEFVNIINYRPDSRTFGIAINLESGLGDQIMKGLSGRRVNKNIKPILDDMQKFLEQRRNEGKTPLISFADFQTWTDLYVSIHLMKLAEVANGLYENRSQWESVVGGEGDPKMRKGVLWEVKYPEKGHDTYFSNRLYGIEPSTSLLDQARNMNEVADEVFLHSMRRHTARMTELGNGQSPKKRQGVSSQTP